MRPSFVYDQNDVFAVTTIAYHHFPRNDVWGEIYYWWRVTTQIWEVLLNNKLWVVTRHQYGIFAAVPQTSFPGDWPVVTLRNVRCFLRLLSSAMKWNSLKRQVFIFLSVAQRGGISYFGHCAHLNSLISGYLYIWHCSARYLYKSKFQCNQYVNSAKTIKPENLNLSEL